LFSLAHLASHSISWSLLVLIPSLCFGLVRDRFGSVGGFKWSLQHILCWPIGASGQAPLQAFSNSAFYEAWH
jgi:hypothetical protein